MTVRLVLCYFLLSLNLFGVVKVDLVNGLEQLALTWTQKCSIETLKLHRVCLGIVNI